MLIRFNVKNFMIFSARNDGKSEEFSMLAGKARKKKDHVFDDGNIKLLKFAAIYGANASGKSSFVRAMGVMKHTVLSNNLPAGYSSMYCKNDSENKRKPSYFEVEIKLKDRYYTYGFEVLLSEGKFISEWLVELKNDEEKVIFSRDILNGETEIFKYFENISEELRSRLTIYAEDVQKDPTTLFLPIMNRNKDNLYVEDSPIYIYRAVYEWFAKNLEIIYPQYPISYYGYLIKADNDKVKEVCRLLGAFGTGITDCQMLKVNIEDVFGNMPPEEIRRVKIAIEKVSQEIKDKHPEEVSMIIKGSNGMFFILISEGEKIEFRTVKFVHNDKSELFNMNEESDGTQRLFDLIEILLAAEDKVYVIDELDRCLHPSLTYRFVKEYLALAKNRNVQLVVTTHESRLMDFDLLRQDEIWMINKSENGAADIYSLDEYNIRFDKKVDKAYLEGRYGGIPLFSTLFPVEEA